MKNSVDLWEKRAKNLESRMRRYFKIN